jgi:rRNA-processing protein FCF1
MKVAYVLDTNAYALLFQTPKSEARNNLELRLLNDGIMSFYIPEIVSMEIHSVLGKFRRGGATEQQELCSKQVINSDNIIACTHTCYVAPRARMKPKVYKGLVKMLGDIEKKQGSIQADLMPLGTREMSAGKEVLKKLAHRFSFGSHDALVAGTVIAANESGLELILVTSDKSLKAVCREEQIPHFDPNIPDEEHSTVSNLEHAL